mgnify:CR=1 FL=1
MSRLGGPDGDEDVACGQDSELLPSDLKVPETRQTISDHIHLKLRRNNQGRQKKHLLRRLVQATDGRYGVHLWLIFGSTTHITFLHLGANPRTRSALWDSA